LKSAHISNKTVIFLDEVQVCTNIITAIKFLVSEGSYRYILSGSLLGTISLLWMISSTGVKVSKLFFNFFITVVLRLLAII